MAGAAVVFAAGIAADDVPWEPRLVPLDRPFRAGDEIRLVLPASVPGDALEYMALELDNVDISQLVRLDSTPEGHTVSVRPIGMLSSGTHLLRLVQYLPESGFVERGRWDIAVPGSELSARADASLDVGYRAADSGIASDVNNTQGQGPLRADVSYQSGGWSYRGRGKFLFDSQGVSVKGTKRGMDPRDGREFDIGDFRLDAKTRPFSAVIGHHALDQRSLVINNFYRRGISLQAENTDKTLAASGFAFSSDPVTGFQRGLGFSDAEHRVAGAMVSARPLPGNSRALTLTATYLQGEVEDNSGVGINSGQTVGDGDAASIAADALLFGGSSRIRGEYARGSYDADAAGDKLKSESDDAYNVFFQYTPVRGGTWAGQPVQLDLGVEQQVTGPFFRSPANPTLPFDRELLRAFATAYWGPLSVQLDGGVESDNVDDDPLYPRLKSDFQTLWLNYRPLPEYSEDGMPRTPWYGDPFVSFAYRAADQKNDRIPENFAGTPIDQTMDYYQLDVGTMFPRGYWSLGYGYGSDKDLTGTVGDRTTETLSALAYWQIGETALFSLQAMYSPVENDLTSVTTRSRLLAGNLDLELVPGSLVGGLLASVQEDDATDHSVDSRTWTYGFHLDWAVVPVRSNRPGLTLWVKGEKQDIENRLAVAGDDGDAYQILTGIGLRLPVYYRRVE